MHPFPATQSATSQSKHAARFLRLAMASIMDILKIKPFVEVSVGQLLWGYEDPLLKLAKDVVPKEQKLPYEEFGLMYGVSIRVRDVSWRHYVTTGYHLSTMLTNHSCRSWACLICSCLIQVNGEVPRLVGKEGNASGGLHGSHQWA